VGDLEFENVDVGDFDKQWNPEAETIFWKILDC
jgi:hypothetical protein